ncbi:unnamed protein product [Meloidogyne enterolobii]|uniref:Uncharacterized protein n=1 Tax=Meloidogyne enterolobii TaxID=390850 RepID=A0ACB1A7G1_MELEN
MRQSLLFKKRRSLLFKYIKFWTFPPINHSISTQNSLDPINPPISLLIHPNCPLYPIILRILNLQIFQLRIVRACVFCSVLENLALLLIEKMKKENM